ncbi:MAG: DUF3151 domain-containing protein [Streptosporangiaceae bacterium]|nr:DUF3151 domain-containing protein [Streptosporangiaceae bacterium]
MERERENLLAGAGPGATYLPEDGAMAAALGTAAASTETAGAGTAADGLKEIAGRFPAYSAAWAALAERALRDGDAVTAYAYARTGYHRGLDQLRRAGWRGNGPVPWEHEPNRGFLRSLHLLGRAAAQIGEDDEAARCRQFLKDSSATAAAELENEL